MTQPKLEHDEYVEIAKLVARTPISFEPFKEDCVIINFEYVHTDDDILGIGVVVFSKKHHFVNLPHTDSHGTAQQVFKMFDKIKRDITNIMEGRDE